MDSTDSSTIVLRPLLRGRPVTALTPRAAGAAFILAFLSFAAPSAQAETIAVFTKSQNSPIFAALRAGAGVAAKTLGVRIIHYVPSTSDSVAEQNVLVGDAIKDKPDAIVFVPVDFAAAAGAVDKINAARIPLVNVNERLTGGAVVGYVGTDDVALAGATARYLVKAMGGKGNVVILDGPDSNLTAQGRKRGFRDALKEFPDIKLLAGKSASYVRAQGNQAMLEMLRLYPQIDGVLAANDPTAIGAAQALKSARRKALVAGINASREMMDLIKSGEVIGSGDYDSFAQGCLGVEMAVRHLRKEATPETVMLKPVVIDKSNDAPFDQPYENRACPTLASESTR